MTTHQERLQKFIEEVTLYPVSCEKLALGRSDRQWLEAVLAAGVKIVQLRDKEADGRTLFNKAKMFRELTRAAGALFIVNDRLDVALLSEADGIHLGNDDLPCEEVRRYAPELIIGVSCNREEEAATAEARGASYYNIGPLFPTGTKEEAREVLGIEAIARFSRHSQLPITVMGGIKKHHLPELMAAGVKRPAVVTALTQAADITAETKNWLEKLQQHRALPRP
ncbi:thiamine phosphate synthase [Desulfurivibrio dismutans]|uniref:thiamine phosphate synthase n=1 Tax=Desulfurivibrio dismutans TaxID=1398908 RepID=UPI0023DB0702|nr:thiamine phosphate synthase [Desulfurivibrio alkaliphilus]MDF1615143.1 thiamine phosphate synthase [Desulfurivibrio alkaliphilus]